jgi:sugar lactone lactonase YvrE
MTQLSTKVLLDGRGFLEAPHWHDGEIWTSDLHRHEVLAISADSDTRVIATLDDQPSGLGFLPDGSAIVVSLLDRKILRVGDLSVLADLTALTVGGTNDMIVDAQGRAYVGSFGYDVFARAPKAPGNLVLVDTDGQAQVVAEDLQFPNGMAFTTEGTLLVAETTASVITEFDVHADGTLANRRVWADLAGRPDGVTIDAEGALWVSFPREGLVARISRGGEVLDEVHVQSGWRAVSCGFGGTNLTTLYVTTAHVTDTETTAAIEWTSVDVPGAVVHSS